MLPFLLLRLESIPRYARLTFLNGQAVLFNSRRLVKQAKKATRSVPLRETDPQA